MLLNEKKPEISLIIPAYQEEHRLPLTMMRLSNFMKNLDLHFEIILVIEPSPDRTLEVARDWERRMAQVKVIVNPKRYGKGGTVRNGVLCANGEYIAFMDADGATDFSFFVEAYHILKRKEAKMVIASRALKDSVITEDQSFFRQHLGKGFRWVTRYVSRLPYRDTQCGAKMFHSSTVSDLFDQLIENGFAFDVELLIKAKMKNIQVKEIPCIWEDVQGSTVHPIKDGMKMMKAIMKMKRYYREVEKEGKAFGTGNLSRNGQSGERTLVVQSS